MITLGSVNSEGQPKDRTVEDIQKISENKRRSNRKYKKIQVPALHFGGWYDTFTEDLLEFGMVFKPAQ